MKAVLAAALALAGSASPALAQIMTERFAAVTIVAGQGVAAVVSNVLPSTAAVPPCSLGIGFRAGDGSPIGGLSSTTRVLPPGHSVSVSARSPAPGLVRAFVEVANPDDCAVRTLVEVYDTATRAVHLVVPSNNCLGGRACATPLP